jgi:hAT family C-terminal dimerisation region
MSSSVSSERAFSQGGLTITKCRNRLKGDIVEALQCIKCAIRHDLLFREPAPSSLVEADLGNGGSGGDSSDGEASEAGWDEKFIGNESDNDIEIVLSS